MPTCMTSPHGNGSPPRQILFKYSRTMKDLLKEIQKLLPPHGTPWRMLNPIVYGSPTTVIYEVIGKVEFVPTSQAVETPTRTAEISKQKEPIRVPEHDKSPTYERTRSSLEQMMSTEPLARTWQVQSSVGEKANTPERAKNLK